MTRHEMNPEAELEKAVDAIEHLEIPDGPPEQLNERLIAALQRGSPPRRIFARMPVDRMARIAAIVTMAVIAGLGAWLLLGGSGSGIAFADIAEVFRRVHSARFTATISEKGENNQVQFMVLEPSRLRMIHGPF